MPLQIIGAGLPRTGTLSLKTALEELGYPTYHMVEVFKHNDTSKWLQVVEINHGRKFADWEYIFTPGGDRKPYTASVDAPGCTFYKQQLAEYPDAKVILTVRDSPSVWVSSAKETVASDSWVQKVLMRVSTTFGSQFRMMVNGTFLRHPDAANGTLEKYSKDGGKSAEEFYTNWIEEVKRSIPANKLLVFNVKQGWEPLCKFLGKPIPNTPFPKVNDRVQFKKRMNWAVMSMLAGSVLVCAALVGLAVGVNHWIKS